ncbi:MAG: hypothetical protein COB66_02780 [Coxiella sp. (in: Bacteria)]|nr:MAG: hypothetical protein COB66_02780 [Coxiella sp. (in: g-proteobacteria)]
MSVLYGTSGIPGKVTDFSLKVRLMIDRRYSVRAEVAYRPSSNVVQFPSNRNKIGNSKSNLYLEACQQLLRPVREFFFEDDDDGGEGGLSVQDLDGYLGDLTVISDQYLDNSDGDEQLDQGERQNLQTDVASLQAAGFEYTNENHPEVIAAYGDQLTDRHLPANYAEIAENSEVAPELKKAYADVKGMVEQAKKSLAPSASPTLSR